MIAVTYIVNYIPYTSYNLYVYVNIIIIIDHTYTAINEM